MLDPLVAEFQHDAERYARRLVDAEAERDRYRGALEEIAEVGGPPYPDWQFFGSSAAREQAMRGVAERALNQTQQGEGS